MRRTSFALFLMLFLAACSPQRPQMPAALAAMPQAERDELLQGRSLYHIRGCAACHGIAGHGNGDRASRLVPPPMDFRLTNAYLQGSSQEAMAATIRTGLTNVKSAMPKNPFLSLEERMAISRYIIHMRENYK
ncbi:MAG: c-type cytochrome [Spirochaetes bacterium]|nr:c-type cytochrome [Spirochaetota bacterium]